ncbi:MAG: phosphoenolpyruvate--protein phosphotransferase [Endomicrobium sp.]|jgi:phosphotransferase system enzyme I (PtsI)|nr:phosphoenolpyruvate--protein phosphotransferase [Endomicrobium sp.]
MFIKQDMVFNGIAASGGIAIGNVIFIDETVLYLSSYLSYKKIPLNKRNTEKLRFYKAIDKTRYELQIMYKKVNSLLGYKYAQIVSVHMLILDDPEMIKNVIELINLGFNAEHSLCKVINKIINSFKNSKDNYLQERTIDIQDVVKKILHNLSGLKHNANILKHNKHYTIVVAHNLDPSDTVNMREKYIKGFAIDIGGKTSHTAILAQGLELPAVVGLQVISLYAKTGDTVIIDGNLGKVILNPSFHSIVKYQKLCKLQKTKNKQELKNLRDFQTETVDHHKFTIYANIDNYDEVQSVLQHGAYGIGLYRTEYMYLNNNCIPSEEDHFINYVNIVKKMNPYVTIIRTVDLGGDKLFKLCSLDKNPFLGLRAIRLCLKYPQILINQLTGILRASAYGKIKIMYPMISSIEELRAANNILDNVKYDLRKKCVKFDDKIEVGVMIEVPSAVMVIDSIVQEVDFVSIGTNDLIQYALAVDRLNENVANSYDPLHPAILRYIRNIIEASHNVGINVSMCGEMASNTYYTPILIGLELDEFSVAVSQITKIKKIIRNISFIEAKIFAKNILQCSDKHEIINIINTSKFGRKNYV